MITDDDWMKLVIENKKHKCSLLNQRCYEERQSGIQEDEIRYYYFSFSKGPDFLLSSMKCAVNSLIIVQTHPATRMLLPDGGPNNRRNVSRYFQFILFGSKSSKCKYMSARARFVSLSFTEKKCLSFSNISMSIHDHLVSYRLEHHLHFDGIEP